MPIDLEIYFNRRCSILCSYIGAFTAIRNWPLKSEVDFVALTNE